MNATAERQRILIVEDEEPIRVGLEDLLVFHGYAVESAVDGPAGLKRALAGRFDLLLLDLMLPGLDGFAVCDQVRAVDRSLPIIMLTARTADEDIVRGLRLGADDYIAKPFSVTELVLRIQAVLRRAAGGEPLAGLRVGGLEIDPETLTGRRGAQEIPFTRREIAILRFLASRDGRPASREELLHRVWGYARDCGLETRTVDIHIAKLRRKLEADPAVPRWLVTVRGVGYRLLTER